MRSIDRVLSALEARECNPRGNEIHGWKALCCSHEDRNPSLKVDYEDEKVLLACYAGCSTEEIVAGMGLEWGDLFDQRDDSSPRPPTGTSMSPPRDTTPTVRPKVVERYDYVDEDGHLIFQVERLEPKTFRQRRPDGRGGWIYRMDETRRVLYRLPAVLDAAMLGERVCVVEGEKDVHTLEGFGILATTSPAGAGKWKPEYSECLRGARVAIIADDDPPAEKGPAAGRSPGHEHARDVAAAIADIAAEVKILRCTKGKDITDHIAAGGRLSELVPLDAPRLELPAAPRLRVMTAREVMEMPTPGEEAKLLGDMVYSGHRLILAAETGAGKTSMCQQIAASIIYGHEFLDFKGRGDAKVLLVDVEQGTRSVQRAYHQSGLADAGDRIGLIHEPSGLHLDTDEGARNELEQIFASREYDVAILDPAYNLFTGSQTDEESVRWLMSLIDDWRREYNTAVLIPMHVRKTPTGAKFSMDEIYGSKAYTWGRGVDPWAAAPRRRRRRSALLEGPGGRPVGVWRRRRQALAAALRPRGRLSQGPAR